MGKRFKPGENVYSSQITYIYGKVSTAAAQALAASLYNPLIESAKILSFKSWQQNRGMDVRIPKVKLETYVQTDAVNLHISDEQLQILGKQGILSKDGSRRGPLALSLTYLKTIQQYFNTLKRPPTDLELESIAQTWSEHCKHTIFADPIDELKQGLFNTYIKGATKNIRQAKGKADICVSVFTDNSGAIAFDEKFI